MRGAARPAFFRIEAVFPRERVLRLRLQPFCVEWLPKGARLEEGAALEVAHGAARGRPPRPASKHRVPLPPTRARRAPDPQIPPPPPCLFPPPAATSQYVSLDWVAMAAVANETADLTAAASWTVVARGVGNPAALHAGAMRAMFGLGQDPRARVSHRARGVEAAAKGAGRGWGVGGMVGGGGGWGWVWSWGCG